MKRSLRSLPSSHLDLRRNLQLRRKKRRKRKIRRGRGKLQTRRMREGMTRERKIEMIHLVVRRATKMRRKKMMRKMKKRQKRCQSLSYLSPFFPD